MNAVLAHCVHCIVFNNFSLSIGIGNYSVYCKYMSHNKENIYTMITPIKQKIINIHINGRS